MNKSMHFGKTLFLGVCLTLGCTSSGAMGCGSDGSSTPTVDSSLLGIYAIDSYQASPLDPETGDPVPDSCDQLSDAPPFGDFLVLYAYEPNDAMGQAYLAGVFCSDVANCREIASTSPEPALGYSFREGSDEDGWRGFGNARQGSFGDQCLVDLQTHFLTSSGQSINITTDTVEVIFPPRLDGSQANCSVADALDAYSPDLPCQQRLVLEASRTADL